jgi:hypothetical protein
MVWAGLAGYSGILRGGHHNLRPLQAPQGKIDVNNVEMATVELESQGYQVLVKNR